MKQYIVDAFTEKPFAGNPAAVCVMEDWPSPEFMQKLAMENNLSEMAFAIMEATDYHLRWFTPGTEVDLCGHATLATAFVILNHVEPKRQEVKFNTRSGVLSVVQQGSRYEMDFPIYEQREIPVAKAIEDAYGVRPVKAFLGTDLVCVFANEEDVRNMQPNQSLLCELPGRIQNATAPGRNSDAVSRSFAPKLHVPEDPVCGSAHCQIAPYWSRITGNQDVHVYQASKRGGHLFCKMREDVRISIGGEAVLVATSEILARTE